MALFKKKKSSPQQVVQISVENVVEILETTFRYRERKMAERLIETIKANIGRPITRADLGLPDGP